MCRVFCKNREAPAVVAAKPDVGRDCYDNIGSSSSLPPLVDSYITFGQTEEPKLNENEQVPRSSIFSPNQPNYPVFSHVNVDHMEDTAIPDKNPCFLAHFSMMSDGVDTFPCPTR